MHVVVGMSGGVDSSVTAYLLQQQGHQVTGLFMKNWDEDDGTEYCTAIEDLADAQAVADKLGIELKTVNFAAEYWDEVFEHFIEEYQAGRTPNPDILCNREIKFKAFLDYARTLGAEAIATAITSDGPNRAICCVDWTATRPKLLSTCTSTAQVSSALFPVGEPRKPEVRRIAEEQGLSRPVKKTRPVSVLSASADFPTFLNAMSTRRRVTSLLPRAIESANIRASASTPWDNAKASASAGFGTIRMNLGLWLIKTCKTISSSQFKAPSTRF